MCARDVRKTTPISGDPQVACTCYDLSLLEIPVLGALCSEQDTLEDPSQT